jgi:TolA-binding protein
MKWYLLALCLAVVSATICAQEADPCAGLAGIALDQCRGNQQKLQQQQLEQQQQQLQQQQARQNQLAEQQQQIQQQLEGMRLQNELLRKQLEHEKSANQPAQSAAIQPAQPPATANSKPGELTGWKSDNSWFGSDYAKTQFAMRYARQLQQERPDLVGRPFLDAISAKVRDTFGASK